MTDKERALEQLKLVAEFQRLAPDIYRMLREDAKESPLLAGFLWCVEKWMGEDLRSITQIRYYEPGHEPGDAPSSLRWTYIINRPLSPCENFCSLDRPTALLNAAIAVAKRRAGHDQP